MTLVKMRNFEKKPAKGGMPASENIASVIANDSGKLKDAAAAIRIPGLLLVENVDEGYAPTYEKSLKAWLQYENTAFFQGKYGGSDQGKERSI